MTGEIYTEQRCPLCGGSMRHDPKRAGLFCDQHHGQAATKRFYVKFGRGVKKRFPSYPLAVRFLNGLRFESDQGKFDPLDYKAACPYAFDHLSQEYLAEKKHLKSYRAVANHMARAEAFFQDKNVKDIKRRDLRQFLAFVPGADKTKANHLATVHNFFAFLVDEEIIPSMPKFPAQDFELGYRKIVSLDVQESIVQRIRENTTLNPKIVFAVEILRTYLNLRPDDIRRIREEDILLDSAALIVWRPTKAKMKRRVVALLPEHVETFREMKSKWPALPEMPFFRWHGTERKSSNTAGKVWGERFLYDTWVKACADLGVKGVDLYGGTRHSSTTALALEVGHDDTKALTDHGTNKAFDRYCQAANIKAMASVQTLRKLRPGGPSVVQAKFAGNKSK